MSHHQLQFIGKRQCENYQKNQQEKKTNERLTTSDRCERCERQRKAKTTIETLATKNKWIYEMKVSFRCFFFASVGRGDGAERTFFVSFVRFDASFCYFSLWTAVCVCRFVCAFDGEHWTLEQRASMTVRVSLLFVVGRVKPDDSNGNLLGVATTNQMAANEWSIVLIAGGCSMWLCAVNFASEINWK